ncbi:MAG: TRAP transporter small permease subunit [Rhodospirillales bacterium]|nr:TRAP transporter small permease subunit [Rhodospirillales bacterium]
MKKLVHRANHLLAGFAGWLMFAMMTLLTADILFRAIDKPLQLMAELSVFVMMIVIYLGFARCEEHNEHVGLEIVVKFMPPRGRAAMAVFSQGLAVLTIGILFYAVTTDAWSAFLTNSSIEGIVDLPIWPTKFIMVVGMVFFFLQGLINLGNAYRRFKTGEVDEHEDRIGL